MARLLLCAIAAGRLLAGFRPSSVAGAKVFQTSLVRLVFRV